MKMRDVKKYEIREHQCVGVGGSALGGFGRPGMGVGGEGLWHGWPPQIHHPRPRIWEWVFWTLCVSFVFRMCNRFFRGIMDYRKVSLLMVILVYVVSVFVCVFVWTRVCVLECSCFWVNVCMSLSLFICQMGLDGWQRQCVSTPVTMVMGAECVSGGGTHGHPWWAPLEDIRRDAGQLSQCCCVPSTRLGELLRTCTPEQVCNVYSRVFVCGRVRQLRTRRLHWWEGGGWELERHTCLDSRLQVLHS